jgi:hypothetical protein
VVRKVAERRLVVGLFKMECHRRPEFEEGILVFAA